MMDPTTSVIGTSVTQALPAPVAMPGRKGLDLAVIKRGSKDYLDFLDTTKETFFAYLYHRTGSRTIASTLLTEIYIDVLARAMSLWWFGTLSLKLLLDTADEALRGKDAESSDIETVYVRSLAWLSPDERASVATLHDALWSLPREAQRLLILSLLIGLSDERIALVLRLPLQVTQQELKTAKEFLITRWQPGSVVGGKLDSLVFAPSLDLQGETKLRFAVVEKYNALKFRKYQWLILAGLFGVLSNVVVASVLAFAVVMQPPTNLRGVRMEVASLDAVALQREFEIQDAKRSVLRSYKEAQRIVAYSGTRDLTALGLAVALESLHAEQYQEKEVNRLIRLMEWAKTAAVPALRIAWRVLSFL